MLWLSCRHVQCCDNQTQNIYEEWLPKPFSALVSWNCAITDSRSAPTTSFQKCYRCSHNIYSLANCWLYPSVIKFYMNWKLNLVRKQWNAIVSWKRIAAWFPANYNIRNKLCLTHVNLWSYHSAWTAGHSKWHIQVQHRWWPPPVDKHQTTQTGVQNINITHETLKYHGFNHFSSWLMIDAWTILNHDFEQQRHNQQQRLFTMIILNQPSQPSYIHNCRISTQISYIRYLLIITNYYEQ